MTKYLIAYVATAVVFFGLDFVWLTVAASFYKDRLGPLLLRPPNLAVAGAFYALYVVGIVIFAETRGFEHHRWTSALAYGALFGFFAYATYDLTNLATLRGYSPAVAAVDLAWGTVLSAVSAAAGYAIATWLAAA